MEAKQSSKTMGLISMHAQRHLPLDSLVVSLISFCSLTCCESEPSRFDNITASSVEMSNLAVADPREHYKLSTNKIWCGGSAHTVRSKNPTHYNNYNPSQLVFYTHKHHFRLCTGCITTPGRIATMHSTSTN